MHVVKATIWNIDKGKSEEIECEVSDDLHTIITNGRGRDFVFIPPSKE